MVEFRSNHLELSGDGENTSDLLVHHKPKNSHHGGTSVVQLNSTLLHLLLLRESIPSEVNESVTEVTNELSSGDVLHDEKLKESNEGNDLSEAGSGDGVGAVDGSPSVGERVEGVTGIVNVSGKVDSVARWFKKENWVLVCERFIRSRLYPLPSHTTKDSTTN
jgi:hypothetical protein